MVMDNLGFRLKHRPLGRLVVVARDAEPVEDRKGVENHPINGADRNRAPELMPKSSLAPRRSE